MDFETIFASFSFGQLQDFATISKHLEKHGLAPNDVASYVREYKDALIGKRFDHKLEQLKARPKCPACLIPMVLRPAGEDPEDGSHWTCPKCRYGRYDPRPLDIVWKETY